VFVIIDRISRREAFIKVLDNPYLDLTTPPGPEASSRS
jgi:hypothetical protein